MDTCKDCLCLLNGHCTYLDDERHPDTPACDLFTPGMSFEDTVRALGFRVVEKVVQHDA